MTAAVGHPTLRLVRVAIDNWSIDGLVPGRIGFATPVTACLCQIKLVFQVGDNIVGLVEPSHRIIRFLYS
ncbi:MAG: hypothetical protein ACI82Z_001897 [Cellvibrionaceae bacterium]|jgi:hypothetical protein